MTRGVVGLGVFVVVSALASYGMVLAGVPMLVRCVVTFGMGWTCAPHLQRLFEYKAEK